jgi:predicted amidohydrolase
MTPRSTLTLALASPRVAASLDEGLRKVEALTAEAAARGAAIVCFPEAYLPGLRGQDFEVLPYGRAEQERVLADVARVAREQRIAVILGLELAADSGRQVAACVFDEQGHIQGFQTKNQIAPSEDSHYVPGSARQLFEVRGVPFGVAICHEGWRYPETVRWAAVRGARIVFHPHHTGSDREGARLSAWGSPSAPYYERAMMMRGVENTIYFASVNYALRYQESATCVIAPSGACQAYLPYGEEGVLVQEIDLEAATGLIARRFAPERYVEASSAGHAAQDTQATPARSRSSSSP